MLIETTVIIIVEVDEKEDPVTSIGQSTMEDLFPEINWKREPKSWQDMLTGEAFHTRTSRILPEERGATWGLWNINMNHTLQGEQLERRRVTLKLSQGSSASLLYMGNNINVKQGRRVAARCLSVKSEYDDRGWTR